MKKFLSLFLVVVIGVVFTACSSEQAVKDVDVDEIYAAIEEVSPVQMGQKIGKDDPDMQLVADLFGVNLDDVEDFVMNATMANVSVDNVAVVKAKEGKVDSVKQSLEDRKAAVVQSFERYLPDRYEVAQEGKVFTVGNYAFLIIGDNAADGQKAVEDMFV